MGKLKEKVLDNIKKYGLTEKGDKVVVGVSGGPDSVCLLHILHSLAGELNIKIAVSHINHMMRGEESDKDECHVRKLSEKLGVDFYSKSINIIELSKDLGISLEEAGREARYNEFQALAQRIGAAKVVVAHNKNDQAETILMRIVRGSGLEGLRGMDFKRGPIIRPLLNVERREIEEYCLNNLLDFRTDSSNLENVYTRNKMRLELIPYIDRLFETNITESIFKMSSVLKDDNDLIDNIVSDSFNQTVKKKDETGLFLDLELFKSSHPAVRRRIIRQAIEQIKGDLKDIERVHIEDSINLALNGKTGSEIHLPCNVRVSKSYGTLKIFLNLKKIQYSAFDKVINIPGETMLDVANKRIMARIEEKPSNFIHLGGFSENGLIKYFDYEKLISGINIRTRREGDVFKPYNSNGTKKLKEYFIDNKISRELRDNIPLVAKGSEIIWIIGYKISDKFKVTENTKKVLRLEYLTD
jgi:tRNA(Ile)-lysidine synthase